MVSRLAVGLRIDKSNLKRTSDRSVEDLCSVRLTFQLLLRELRSREID